MPPPTPPPIQSGIARVRTAVVAVVAVVALMAGAACSGDDEAAPTASSSVPSSGSSVAGSGGAIHGGGSPDPTTNPALSTQPRIERFDVDPGECRDGAAMAEVHYLVPDATFVTFLLDDEQAPTPDEADDGGDPRAEATRLVEVPCDGRAHTLVLVAVDAEGRQSVQSTSLAPD